jgi:MoxR-like ATPase
MENFEFQNDVNINRIIERTQALKTEIGKVIIGQHDLLNMLMVALVADGHVLLEGVPGIAKTLTTRMLAKAIDTSFKRIQFTPDLMPSDVIGTSIFNPQKASFEFREGPIFGNIVLIDEINRAPAKTQSSLFEVMEERSVTVDGTSYKMEEPFLVIATQNPIEHEGTYQLPEAQLDRFLFKLIVGYPSMEEEFIILKNRDNTIKDAIEEISKVITVSELLELRALARRVKIEDNLIRYITKLVHDTRSHPALYLGASPRAGIATMSASKALAAINGRDFVIPEDITQVITSVLRHRIALTPEKEMDGVQAEDVINEIIKSNDIPR